MITRITRKDERPHMTPIPASPTPIPQWSDLWCRRTALGLTQTRLADYLGITQPNIAAAENGRRPVPAAIWPAIERLEHHAARLVDDLYRRAPAVPEAAATVWLDTYLTDSQYPARVSRRYPGLPAETHRIATARAAAALIAAGYTVRIRMPN